MYYAIILPRGGVIFIDSDDYIHMDAIRTLVDEMQRTDADVVEMSYKRFIGPISRTFHSRIPPQVIDQPELFNDYFISFFGINILGVNMWGKLYKTEVLRLAALEPSGFRMGEDLIFNMRLFPMLKRISVLDYPGYHYRVSGLTSGFNPTLWTDLRQQYFLKREFALQHNYDKALRPLYIELKNIFLSTVCQRMEYLHEVDDELRTWIGAQLDDSHLWADIRKAAPGESDPIYTEIAAQDSDAVLAHARAMMHTSRHRRRIKKVLRLFFR